MERITTGLENPFLEEISPTKQASDLYYELPRYHSQRSSFQEFTEQTQALFRKTSLLLWRSWMSTIFRALVLPLCYAAILGYSKNFYVRNATYGISTPYKIPNLPEVVGSHLVVYYAQDNILTDEMHRIMNLALDGVPQHQIISLKDKGSIYSVCAQNLQGSSDCYGAIQWNSIELNSEINVYNYTLRGNSGLTYVNVDTHQTDTDNYVLPLQWAVDRAITNLTTTPRTMPFTSRSKEWYSRQTTKRFMKIVRDWISPALYLTLIGVVYHMTSMITLERQNGITSLLTSMGNGQLSRITADHLAFSSAYGLSWILLGIVLSYLFFINSNPAVIIFYHIFSGMSQISWAIFLGNIFRNAQVAGISSSGISTLLGILSTIQAQATGPGGGGHASGIIYFLSFVFPPMNYCFFTQNMARAEMANQGINLVKPPPGSSVYSIVIFLAAIFQIFFFIGVSLLLENLAIESNNRPTENAPVGTAIQLSNISKIYKTGGSIRKMRGKPNIVNAVNDLSLQVRSGQIACLLGANGSGKTTSLEMIAGIQSASSGSIQFQPGSKVGICPQKNVLWDNLTVKEHVEIWGKIKGVSRESLSAVTSDLIIRCGLENKVSAFTKHLSGGQKRKVQLAIMFAGGSNICCIDEASSGLDPVSRRIIWDILLAHRGTHTMIITTHFLDEADILSDIVAIMSKGTLKAVGTTVNLKESLGGGYRVFVSHPATGNEEIYEYPDAFSVAKKIAQLEKNELQYRVAGPQLEDVFLNVARADHESYLDNFPETLSTEMKNLEDPPSTLPTADIPGFEDKPVGFYTQLLSMLEKRFLIFRRSPLPEIVMFCFPIIVALVCKHFLATFPGAYCRSGGSSAEQDYSTFNMTNDMNFPIAGQTLFINSIAGVHSFLRGMTSYNMQVFNNNHTLANEVSSQYLAKGTLLLKNYQDWLSYINTNYSTVAPGGLYLDDPVIAYQADISGGLYSAPILFNMLTNTRANGSVSVVTNFSPFQIPWVPYTGKVLQFVMYFGLTMACAPAFAGLYPTYERLSKVRAMQYSNGLRVLPLWTAYTLFQFGLIIIMCAILKAILVSGLEFIHGGGYLFIVLMLYGMSSSLMSYVVSLFVQSQLASFAITAAYQSLCLLIYLIGYLCTQAYASPENIARDIWIVHFTISLISPISNLCRSLFVTVNLFGILCTKEGEITYMGNIGAFGGPILYLTLQCILMFLFLVWYESGSFRFKKNWLKFQFGNSKTLDFSENKAINSFERKLSTPHEVMLEACRVEKDLSHFKEGLALLKVTKEFGNSTVVNNLTFGVEKGECFALLGPNGAGKTTTFNMIRGEVKMSSGEIYVTGIPVSKHRTKARARLGVCPQFDAMDKMTVEEVLSFYLRIRGLKRKFTKSHVDRIIDAVGISRFRTRMANKLSGGNMRKLSLAVSLIGDPKVLLLDEPSSGMDAFAKRIMWKTLFNVAHGRSIILTTHSMEEADALANRAGFLARSMLSIGTTNELRQKHGSGYHVHVVCKSAPNTTREEMDEVVEWIQQALPGATVEDRMYQGQIKLSIPTIFSDIANISNVGDINSADIVSTYKLSDIFSFFEQSKLEMGIDTYSVSHTSLEEVFLKIVGEYDEATND